MMKRKKCSECTDFCKEYGDSDIGRCDKYGMVVLPSMCGCYERVTSKKSDEVHTTEKENEV